MNYNFDKEFDRSHTKCRKWDASLMKEKFGVSENAIAMDIADMDFPCAPCIQEALVKKAMSGDYGYSYCYDEFYNAVIHWNKERFACEIQKEWIRLTFGTCATLHHIVACFCEKGDAVMINTPAYAPFQDAILQGDCRPVYNPLKILNGRYTLDFELMEQQMQNENVKLFIFCSPQNPSGIIWSKEELRKLSQLCIKYNVLLVSDEIHRDIVFQPFTTIFNAHEKIREHSILCVSANKGFNLGGLKSSYVVIANEKIRNKFWKYLEKVYVTSPHVFAVPAIVAAYTEGEEWLRQATDYIQNNFNVLYDWFQKNLPKAHVMKADGSFLAWIDMRAYFKNEDELKSFFQACDITVVVGSYFVANGEGWVRMNVGTQLSRLKEALSRMETMLTKKIANREITGLF